MFFLLNYILFNPKSLTFRKSFMSVRFAFLFILSAFISSAQRIDHLSTVSTPKSVNYVEIQYDNDLFARRDNYYTQGISIVAVYSSFRKNPINSILVDLPDFESEKFGLSLNHAVFTPTSILSDSILKNDRPFSANWTVGFFKTGIIAAKKRQLSSELELGIIGPGAFGKEMQTGIHRWTNNNIPRGWEYQLKNAPIVNYSLQIDQQFYAFKSLISLVGRTKASIGSYQTNFNLGLDSHLGQRNNPYSDKTHKFEYFIYSKSNLKLVGYDAGLMGGIRFKNENYYIPYAELNRLVAEQHFGFIVCIPHVYFGFDYAFITKEFKQGISHSWGGIRIGFN
jgi:lipid A 3-O-deacylase